MLIEFRIKNFRSIKDEQTLSMLPASKLQERPISLQKTSHYKSLNTLSSLVLYGSNNAGKSNTLKAFHALQWLVVKSPSRSIGDKLDPNEFFLLNSQSLNQSTEFFIDFVAEDNLRYQYFIKFDKKQIITEELWVFTVHDSQKMSASKLFVRNMGSKVSYGDFKGQRKGIENELLDNQSFLAMAVQKKNEQLIAPYLFIRNGINLSFFENEGYSEIQLRSLGKFIYENKTSPTVQLIEDILNHSDAGSIGFDIKSASDMPEIKFPDSFPEEKKEEARQRFIEQFQYEIAFKYRFFDGENELDTTTIPLKEQSMGTKKMMALLNEVLTALANGHLLVVDELDKSLHSSWTKMIINLFHNPKTNPKNAQLIMTTHDSSLLDGSLFGRDQMYFIEKDRFGASQLYALSSFKGIRSNQPFDRLYQDGRLGAIPVIRESYIIKQIENSPIFNVKAG
jgi:AAA15 family ATPase/GTPase